MNFKLKKINQNKKLLIMEEYNNSLLVNTPNVIYIANTEINKLTPYQRLVLNKDIKNHFLKVKIEGNKSSKFEKETLNKKHNEINLQTSNSFSKITKSLSTESILETSADVKKKVKKVPVGIPKQILHRKRPLLFSSEKSQNSIPSKQILGFQQIFLNTPKKEILDSTFQDSIKKAQIQYNNLNSINLSKIDNDISNKINKLIKSLRSKKFAKLKKNTISILENN